MPQRGSPRRRPPQARTEQITGSFKVRGRLNALAAPGRVRAKGIHRVQRRTLARRRLRGRPSARRPIFVPRYAPTSRSRHRRARRHRLRPLRRLRRRDGLAKEMAASSLHVQSTPSSSTLLADRTVRARDHRGSPGHIASLVTPRRGGALAASAIFIPSSRLRCNLAPELTRRAGAIGRCGRVVEIVSPTLADGLAVRSNDEASHRRSPRDSSRARIATVRDRLALKRHRLSADWAGLSNLAASSPQSHSADAVGLRRQRRNHRRHAARRTHDSDGPLSQRSVGTPTLPSDFRTSTGCGRRGVALSLVALLSSAAARCRAVSRAVAVRRGSARGSPLRGRSPHVRAVAAHRFTALRPRARLVGCPLGAVP